MFVRRGRQRIHRSVFFLFTFRGKVSDVKKLLPRLLTKSPPRSSFFSFSLSRKTKKKNKSQTSRCHIGVGAGHFRSLINQN